MPVPAVKKRRTFFSSNLPFLPKIPASSRPATTPSERVLAALGPPVVRHPSSERPVRVRKQVRNDQPVETEKAKPGPKEPTSPRIPRPPRTTSKPLIPVKPARKLPVVVATRRANASSRADKAQSAQSTNSKLSAAMEMAMRSTISGRAKPYMRDNTWTVMSVPPMGKGKEKVRAPGGKKEYMAAGFYCQNANAKSPHKLVSKVLKKHQVVKKVKRRGKGKKVERPKRGGVAAQASTTEEKENAENAENAFPPLPYDHGYDHFFGKEHEFVLPYNIQWEAENGSLDGKKKPMPYQKLRGSRSFPRPQRWIEADEADAFPERARVTAEHTAVCKCDPEIRCGDNCINRIMSYLCGKECPCGDACENKSLARRKMSQTKVVYVRACVTSDPS